MINEITRLLEKSREYHKSSKQIYQSKGVISFIFFINHKKRLDRILKKRVESNNLTEENHEIVKTSRE